MAGVMPSTQWEMKNFHQRYYPGNTISVGIGQGETQVTPLQLARALGGIASDGHFVRPHVVEPSPDSFQPISAGDQGQLPRLGRQNRASQSRHLDDHHRRNGCRHHHGTAAASHIEGIDFAGKTGTAQVVGGGDTHTKGGAKTPNSWFVGMVPRRNPEIVITVLQEHGDWGSLSAHIAAQMVTTYVNKKRAADQNILNQASLGKPVEMGAVWSEPAPGGHHRHGARGEDSVLHAGHFMVDPGPLAPAKSLASSHPLLPAWLLSMPLRFKEGQP
jgi:penicillin-binding protein 2